MEEESPTLMAKVDELQRQFTVLSHQMNAIMMHLQMSGARFGIPAANGTHPVLPSTNGAAKTETATPSENGSATTEDEMGEEKANGTGSLPLTPTLQGQTGNIFAETHYGGRKSAFCKTPEMKAAVAEYAAQHGAANAARKFGIPPNVAAYYNRKLKLAQKVEKTAGVLGGQCAISGEGGEMNLALGSVGRSRGRPRMIGDELDAELMEHMLKYRSENPSLHPMRPELALQMAHEFIKQHQPAKLKENGGNIELRMSWANKLVSRVAEREMEVRLGLKTGSLNNVGLTGLKNLEHSAFLGGGTVINEQMLEMLLAQTMPKEENFIVPEITDGKVLRLEDFVMISDDTAEDKMLNEDSETVGVMVLDSD